jgi:transposase-like protein
VSKVNCPECERGVPVHRLETQTVAQREGFATNYRCPFCRADFSEPTEFMA